MSAAIRVPPAGAIERLTGTAPFRLLFGLTMIAAACLLLLGLPLSALLLAMEPREGAPLFLWVAGGALGVAGWVRSRRHTRASSTGSIEATFVCLCAGIATSAVSLLYIATGALEVARWHPDAGFAIAATVGALGVAIIGAVGLMAAVKRKFALWHRRPFDSLPAALLVVALAQAVAVIVVASTLAA